MCAFFLTLLFSNWFSPSILTLYFCIHIFITKSSKGYFCSLL
ncbi:hypothetical protein PHET_11107, partial [Paragonimus heterotremus]